MPYLGNIHETWLCCWNQSESFNGAVYKLWKDVACCFSRLGAAINLKISKERINIKPQNDKIAFCLVHITVYTTLICFFPFFELHSYIHAHGGLIVLLGQKSFHAITVIFMMPWKNWWSQCSSNIGFKCKNNALHTLFPFITSKTHPYLKLKIVLNLN